jgi:hypothetical protein
MTPRFFPIILFSIQALIVGSCADDGPGTIWVDPGKFAIYKCDDLARRWKDLSTRENELRNLIEKANDSTAGAVVGSIAYRSDYEAVLSEEKLLQRIAADKKCTFMQDYQSDHLIR